MNHCWMMISKKNMCKWYRSPEYACILVSCQPLRLGGGCEKYLICPIIYLSIIYIHSGKLTRNLKRTVFIKEFPLPIVHFQTPGLFAGVYSVWLSTVDWWFRLERSHIQTKWNHNVSVQTAKPLNFWDDVDTKYTYYIHCSLASKSPPIICICAVFPWKLRTSQKRLVINDRVKVGCKPGLFWCPWYPMPSPKDAPSFDNWFCSSECPISYTKV